MLIEIWSSSDVTLSSLEYVDEMDDVLNCGLGTSLHHVTSWVFLINHSVGLSLRRLLEELDLVSFVLLETFRFSLDHKPMPFQDY